MGWFNKQTLEKIGQIAGVVVPLAVPQAKVSLGVAQAALALINAATKDGTISEMEVAQINSLLVPYGFAVVHVKPEDATAHPG